MPIAPFYVLTMAVCCDGGADPEVPLTEAQEAELIATKLCSHSEDDQKKIQALVQLQSVVNVQGVEKLLD